eukprot:jgi/Botrbrau1/8715/Bobra.0311s0026.2
MSRKRTLAEDLADLATPAPGSEAVGEEVGFGDGARLEDTDDELLPLENSPAKRKRVEERSRMRADILLDGPEYAGKKTTRLEAFGGASSSSESEKDWEEDGDEEEGVGAAKHGGSRAGRPAAAPGHRRGAAGRADDGDHDESESEGLGEEGEHSSELDSNGEEEVSVGEEESSDGVEQDNDDVEEGSDGEEEESEGEGTKYGLRKASNGGYALHEPGEKRKSRRSLTERARADRALLGTQGTGNSSSGSSEEERESDSDRDDRDAFGPGILGGGREEEMEALEREYEGTVLQDVTAAARLRERASREAATGRAILHQRKVWERLLGMRIALQRCVGAVNRLPRPDLQPWVEAASPQLQSSYRGLREAVTTSIDSLLDLQAALLTANPNVQAARAGGRGESASTSQDVWTQLQEAYDSTLPYHMQALDSWHARAVLGRGEGAGRNGLKGRPQPISAQLAHLLREPSRLNRSLQLWRSQAPRPLGHVPDQAEGGADGLGSGAASQEDEKDPETLDDSQMYQQLLKEFIDMNEEAALLASAAVVKVKKKRRGLDKGASKGRKLRYDVHDKLVNFMAPRPTDLPPMASQLFSNLFGTGRVL